MKLGEIHSVLNRQLKKTGLTSEEAPVLPRWREFLDRVNRSYVESDQERYLLERSLMISSEEMKDVYEKLRESEKRYALAAQGANDGLWDWDLTTDKAYYSHRWVEIMGMKPEPGQEPCKRCWMERIHPEDIDRVVSELDAHMAGKTKHFQNEHRVLHSDGEYRWVLSRGLAVRNESGNAVRMAGSLTDITERKQAEEKMAFDAVHDSLTGLPNRKSLMNRLDRTLRRARHDESIQFGVMFIDLDRFKVINDSLGHQSGDKLLLAIAAKLMNVLRPSDMVARLGGDEFVLLVDNVRERAHLEEIAERVLIELSEPVEIEGQEIYSGASIGVAIGSHDYERPDDIVRDADLAMYRAKARGKGRYEFFDSHSDQDTISRLQLEIELRKAIDHGQFVLYYQPIVALVSEKVIGFESLIRWQHPVHGLVPPNDFIPIAEETGLITTIGEWVLHEACTQLRQWQDEFPEAADLVMNVNLSARQLEQKNLLDLIRRTLNLTGLSPNCLKLEITESVIMNNAEQTIETVNNLRELGVRVSIDEFGTGYSSLSYLHRFPIDTLKVDRSFISRIEDGEGAEIVQTIVTLAYTLGMDVVAEGVETIGQSKFLQEMKCSYGQGYYYSRPMDPEKATEVVRNLGKAAPPPPEMPLPVGVPEHLPVQ
ncbi:MAG: EAL domain-containing protein [Pyrinomonadaceae bacterium]